VLTASGAIGTPTPTRSPIRNHRLNRAPRACITRWESSGFASNAADAPAVNICSGAAVDAGSVISPSLARRARTSTCSAATARHMADVLIDERLAPLVAAVVATTGHRDGYPVDEPDGEVRSATACTVIRVGWSRSAFASEEAHDRLLLSVFGSSMVAHLRRDAIGPPTASYPPRVGRYPIAIPDTDLGPARATPSRRRRRDERECARLSR